MKREEGVGASSVSMIECYLRHRAHVGVCAAISLENFFAMPLAYPINTILPRNKNPHATPENSVTCGVANT